VDLLRRKLAATRWAAMVALYGSEDAVFAEHMSAKSGRGVLYRIQTDDTFVILEDARSRSGNRGFNSLYRVH